MTYDDGIVTIYDVTNIADPGEIPQKGLSNPVQFHFQEQTLGVTRFYEAIKANQQVDMVIAIIRASVYVDQIAVINDDQFRIAMVQQTIDDNGLKNTTLTLERTGDSYVIAGNDSGAGENGTLDGDE